MKFCLYLEYQYPVRFQPIDSTATPHTLFDYEHRFIRKKDPREILIFTDGTCSGNGQKHPQAGCAIVHRPSIYSQTGQLTHGGTVRFRLETEGPTGIRYQQTSNRAKLRAVIAALHFRDWSMDCNRSWRSLVIATDSEYAAINVTERVQNWETNGWKLSGGGDVKNQDLWKLLPKLIRKLLQGGVKVSFWRIPREWNSSADEFAKSAVDMKETLKFEVLESSRPIQIKIRPFVP
ncbi:hypothetical protein G7Y89_g11452 [Cudoniella acicularis]|uniref:ribonuclease H n=1 Tax=Cudoniella acicularis TaxID=354080 RepID=A0A8H4RAV4_9HELO|nr:hypothetical protein G7Y89_g11452 [Cudoniella acicularis]